MQTTIVHQRPELPAKSLGLFPSCGPCLTSVSATTRIGAILPHLCIFKHVQMPTPFRASKLLPVALHFACKVRYVRRVPSSVVRNKFGVRSVRLLFGSILSRLQTAANWLKSASWIKAFKACQMPGHAKPSRDVFESQLSEPLFGRCCYPSQYSKKQYRRICVPGWLSLVGVGGCMFGRFQLVVRTAYPVKMHLHNFRHIQPNRF